MILRRAGTRHGGAMQHGIHAIGGAAAGFDVADIAFEEFNAIRHPCALAIDQAVQHPHAVTGGQQAFAKMAADESGAAGDQDILHVSGSYRAGGKNPDRPVC